MRQLRIGAMWLAACLIGVDSSVARGADDPKTARLDRLAASPLFLQAPAEVKGDFQIAKAAPEIDFAVFPGQVSGANLWSSWGESLFASDGKFYGSVGDHHAPHGRAYVYAIDPAAKTVKLVVDYNEVVKVPDDKYTPGKIHGGIVDGGDGWIYFCGYRGNVRETTAENDYKGDWLLRHNLQTGETENLGVMVPFSSVPCLCFHAPSRSLYGLSVPGKTMPEQRSQFFRYSLDEKRLVFAGGPNSQVVRALIVGKDGSVFFGDREPGQSAPFLVRYNPQGNDLTTLTTRLPGAGTLRAASEPDAQGVAYGFSQDGLIFAFDTAKATVSELVPAFVTPPLYTATCRLDPTGRYLYYIPGAHGGTVAHGTALIQLDVQTRRRKVLCFLNAAVREQRQYNLGGTYGIALNADGSQLFINWNGSTLPLGKTRDFGLCTAMVVHIPQSERAGD